LKGDGGGTGRSEKNIYRVRKNVKLIGEKYRQARKSPGSGPGGRTT